MQECSTWGGKKVSSVQKCPYRGVPLYIKPMIRWVLVRCVFILKLVCVLNLEGSGHRVAGLQHCVLISPLYYQFT